MGNDVGNGFGMIADNDQIALQIFKRVMNAIVNTKLLKIFSNQSDGTVIFGLRHNQCNF